MYVTMNVRNTYNEIHKRERKSIEAAVMMTRMEELLERKRSVAETQADESGMPQTETGAATAEL